MRKERKMATLGQKLRELRHQKGYKLNDVAEGANLSISFISLIERDKASISVDNLKKLANFYNVRLFQIFQDIEEEGAFVIRASQLPMEDFLASKEPTLYLLSPGNNLSFQIILAIIPTPPHKNEIMVKKGESFLLVKEGQIEINLPNQSSLVLYEGDSAYLTSFKSTSIKNTSFNQPVKLFLMTSSTTKLMDHQGDTLSLHQLYK